METVLVFMIPVVIFLVSSVLAGLLAKGGKKFALAALATIGTVFTTYLMIGVEAAQGWDSLGYFVALLGLSAPSGAGLGIGALVGWMRQKNEQFEEFA